LSPARFCCLFASARTHHVLPQPHADRMQVGLLLRVLHARTARQSARTSGFARLHPREMVRFFQEHSLRVPK